MGDLYGGDWWDCGFDKGCEWWNGKYCCGGGIVLVGGDL